MTCMPYDHLDERAIRLLDLPNELRLAELDVPLWIGYGRAQAGLRFLGRILNHKKMDRMPCGIIVAHTNNGKTTLVRRFESLHQPVVHLDEGRTRLSILFVSAPRSPDVRAFYRMALDTMNVPTASSLKLGDLEADFLHYLRDLDVRMLIVDELHNLLAGPLKRRREFINMLRIVSNVPFRIPVVGVGTQEALQVLNSDDQMANRYLPFPLPRWNNDEEYLTLLDSYERILPLKEPSGLSERRLAARIFAMSERYIGEIYSILKLATAEAVQRGEERITLKILEAIEYTGPSKRKREANAILD